MNANAPNPPALLDWGVASLPLPGETVSGDFHLVRFFPGGALVAAVDGLGHGAEAAAAAQAAVATLQARPAESVLTLIKRCHHSLKETRGAVLTLASFQEPDAMMTWAGIGNVEGVVLRADPKASPLRDYALLDGGVVGMQLSPLRAFVIPITPGDLLLMATDGIRSGFWEGLPLGDSPQQLADRILARDAKGTDDALVVVARYRGEVP